MATEPASPLSTPLGPIHASAPPPGRTLARRTRGAAAVLATLVLGVALSMVSPGRSHPVAAAEPAATPGPVATTGLPAATQADASGAPSPDPQPGASPAIPEDFALFWEALAVVQEHYVDTGALTDENLTRGAIRGMVEALGDTGHTVYLTADEVQAELDALDGRVSGIGVSVDTRSGSPVIIAVYPGSPAQQAGLRPGDVIESVDGRRVDRLDLPRLLDRVRGEAGTPVTLGIERPDGTSRRVRIVRAEVVIPPVSWSMVPGTTIAHIGINQFSDGSGRAARRAVRRALDQRATAAVIDLRGNPGGLVDEAITVASLFLPTGSTVYLEQDRAGDRTAMTTRDDPIAPDLPLMVLVDQGSASSAEIVAVALRDAGRARLLGETTFGTGTVLNLFSLSDGSAIRLGVVQWLTPGGVGVFESGVEPDVHVALPATAAMLSPNDLEGMTARRFRRSDDLQLRRAVRLLRDARTAGTRPSEAPPSSIEAVR